MIVIISNKLPVQLRSGARNRKSPRDNNRFLFHNTICSEMSPTKFQLNSAQSQQVLLFGREGVGALKL
jgi:hypothetical protein